MTEHKCEGNVSGNGWVFSECGRIAKYVYVHHNGKLEYFCGMHSRTLRRYFPELVMTIEEYEKCQQN